MSSHTLFDQVDLQKIPEKSYILEIGSVRDKSEFKNGQNSTAYFYKLAQGKNFFFNSVDFSKNSIAYAKQIIGNLAVQADGEEFLKNFHGSIGILYLDNFDIVYNEKHRKSLMERVGSTYDDNHENITNTRSAEVHLNQLKAAFSKMTCPCFIGIDDTMIRNGAWWGKGALVMPYLIEKGFIIAAQDENGIILMSPDA